MAKPGIPKAEDKAILQAADLILQRAGEVKVPVAKDRALELARLVLVGNADFGGREMRDQQIVKVIEAEQIGLATFRKALSTARKELVKPKATIGRRARNPAAQTRLWIQSASASSASASASADVLPLLALTLKL